MHCLPGLPNWFTISGYYLNCLVVYIRNYCVLNYLYLRIEQNATSNRCSISWLVPVSPYGLKKGVSHKFQNAFHIKWYNVNILIVLLLVMDWDCNMGVNEGNMIKKTVWIIELMYTSNPYTIHRQYKCSNKVFKVISHQTKQSYFGNRKVVNRYTIKSPSKLCKVVSWRVFRWIET